MENHFATHFALFFILIFFKTWPLSVARFDAPVQRFTPDGEMADASTQLTISVKPGWKRGIKVTFPGEGDEGPGALPADVVLVVAERSVFALFFGLGARNIDKERVSHHTFFAA